MNKMSDPENGSHREGSRRGRGHREGHRAGHRGGGHRGGSFDDVLRPLLSLYSIQ